MFEDNKKNNLKNNCSNLFLVFLLFVSINLKNCENSLFGEKKTLEIDSDRYTLDLVIKLKNEFSDDWISDLFAETYGLKKIARISDLDKSLFHFRIFERNNRKINQSKNNELMSGLDEKKENFRLRRLIHDNLNKIKDDDRVEFIFPQISLNREKRSFKDHNIIKIDKKNENIAFNDINYDKQWYLINDGQLNISRVHDMNVKEGWNKGFTGKNISIVVIDDGLDYEHPEFKGKYRPDISYDLNDENDPSHDPMPATFDEQNNHGTKCAGVVAANGNNSVCGVGIAFDAEIGAIRVLDGIITDLIEARALAYKSKIVDIKSASWGPSDDGTNMEYPGPLVNLALEDGVTNGRNGKGTLYVWASGNGGSNNDDCSCDGYASHWNIISIGTINHNGLIPYFMELCPSTMAVVYSGGQKNINGDEDDPIVRVVSSDVRGKCSVTFQGTSSAAPLAAGAFALILEANPKLSYRDVMHLITKTARIPNLLDVSGWIVNGGRYHINEKYGFGVLDVGLMIQKAQKWINVPERKKCDIEYTKDFPELKSGKKSLIKISTQTCINIDFLEHVVANISLEYSIRGNIRITLISPHGTPSEILSFRKNDKSKTGFRNFPFMTLFNWGENPRGMWTLVIETKQDFKNSIGKLKHFSLTFYGIRKNFKRSPKKKYQDLKQRAYFPDRKNIEKIYEREIIESRTINIKSKNF